MKKTREYNGYIFEDNGHGDYYNAELDKFLIYRPYPMMVKTIIHKDDSVTMNREKFQENTEKNKGVYEEGYEENDDGSVFVKAEDVDEDIKKESEDNVSRGNPTDFKVSDRQVKAMQLYEDGEIDYQELVDDYFEGDGQDAGYALDEFGSERAAKELTPPEEGQLPADANQTLSGPRDYRFDFGFKDGASLRSDSFEEAKAYLEEEDMAQYLDEPLKSKIDSMKWVLDSTEKVHVDVKANQPLTPEDMKQLKSEIEGQNSDGLGEGFEQQDFAEAYWNPETGDGPYTRQEVMDIVSENYDNMDFDEYQDYIDADDIRTGLEEYIKDGYGDSTFEDYLLDNDYVEDESEVSEKTREELIDDYSDAWDSYLDDEESSFLQSGYAEDYIPSDALENAKYEVAKNDYRYNENLWGDGMVSMEWDIPDGKDVTPEPAPDNLPSKNYSDYNGLMLADQDEYGDYFFNKADDMKKLGESIVNDLNNNKFDSDSDYKFRLVNDGRNLEIYDSSEAQGSQENPDFDKLEKELKKQLGDNIYLEPYDSVSVYVAGIYGNEVPEENVRRDNDDSYEESQKSSFSNKGPYSSDEDHIGQQIYSNPRSKEINLEELNKQADEYATSGLKENSSSRSTETPNYNNYSADEQDILDRYTKDYGWDDNDGLKNLKHQIDSMKYGSESVNQTARRLVQGGDFLIYNGDMDEYLKERNIPHNEDNTFDVYTKVMADKIEQLYNSSDRPSMSDLNGFSNDYSDRYIRNDDIYETTNRTIDKLKSADGYSSIDIQGPGNYHISKYDTGTIQISSSHPYDLSDYSFAKWSNMNNAFSIYDDNGKLVTVVKTIEEAVEEMKKIDKKIPSRIDRT